MSLRQSKRAKVDYAVLERTSEDAVNNTSFVKRNNSNIFNRSSVTHFDGTKLFDKLDCFVKPRLSEIVILSILVMFVGGIYFYHDTLNFHLLRTYAWAGSDQAQQLVGQRYALGKGVQKHAGKAMEYFKMAADQGHPQASHNLALGHVTKYTNLEPGEARRLLNHAAAHGVAEAHILLDLYCDKKQACND
ncbi:uncharacterized protein [Watersipora subatra]|uniref:uncharacterized protein n=1 Tax=Watersipora subatra TaxID=2589382 RepID=UPI00355C2A55